MKIILLLVVILFLYFSGAVISVLIKKNNVWKNFTILEPMLISKYEVLSELISKNPNLQNGQNIKTLLEKLMEIPFLYKNIDRIIGIDYELTTLSDEAIKTLPEETAAEYLSLMKRIVSAEKIYNRTATVLKTATEVFPYSYAARLMEIRYADRFRV